MKAAALVALAPLLLAHAPAFADNHDPVALVDAQEERTERVAQKLWEWADAAAPCFPRQHLQQPQPHFRIFKHISKTACCFPKESMRKIP